MSDETLRSDIEDSEPDARERGSISSGVKNLDQNQPGRDALCNYSMKPLQMQQPASGGKRVRDSDSGFQSEDEDETAVSHGTVDRNLVPRGRSSSSPSQS